MITYGIIISEMVRDGNILQLAEIQLFTEFFHSMSLEFRTMHLQKLCWIISMSVLRGV